MAPPPEPRSHAGGVRAAHAVGHLAADHGGPSRTVTSLCRALAAVGVSVEIVTTPPRGAEDVVRPPESLVAVRYAEAAGALWQRAASPFAQAVAAVARPAPAVVHDHGLWLPTNLAAAHAARRAGVPLVVSPHGMLSAWALGFNRTKKRAAWALYQRRALGWARLFQVSAEAEGEDVRRAGLRQPVAIIPHGVDGPPAGLPPRTCPTGGARQALFLSRIHPKKGLLPLVEAWAAVRPPGWALTIAGPDENGHRAEVERRVQALGLGDVVSFRGPADDDEKWALYAGADLFVLPTFSENFGIVVAEALVAGVPVLTTRAAPWRVLEERGCGWWIELGAEPLAAALAEATRTPEGALRAMGERGRAYAEANLSWTRVAAEQADVYRWLVGTGPRPACVETG